MSKTPVQLQPLDQAVGAQLSAITVLPKIACPYTTVVKRAQCTDFSQDLLPRFGIERVMTQAIQEVQGEVGPNGERVFKPINDVHDAVRFVGAWTGFDDVSGQSTQSPSASTDYWEITFYGTGLNVLVGFNNTSNRSVNISVDGGANTLVAFTGTTGSTVLNSRNYSTNMVFNIVSGLTLGLHTVRVINNGTSSHLYSGYEVLNTTSTLQQTPGTSYLGGKRLYTSGLTTDSYNSNFESGTLGTRGGHVLVYQKADGTIGKAVTPTNASAAYLASADHTNEEVIRTYSVFEFGAGRTDDYSRFSSSGAYSRAFTLDDGTTTLVTSATGDTINANGIGMDGASGTSFTTLTFVGTGLDVFLNQSGTFGVSNVSIDGAAGIALNNSQNTPKWVKIASGLPYGTHTCKISVTAGGAADIFIQSYTVYGPSKPAIPSGAVELASYYVMADYIPNSTAGTTTIATGVLRKSATRESVYVNGTGGTVDWTAFGPFDDVGGIQLYSDRLNAYVEYTFMGTGFEHRFQVANNSSANIQVSLQSLSTGGTLQNLTTTNFPSISGNTSAYGTGAVFTPSTGILDMADAGSAYGAGFRVSSLPFGLYKVRLLNNSAASYLRTNAFDIITPIHSPKGNIPGDIQNTANVGSCALSDNRKFSATSVKPLANWAQAVAVSSGGTTTSTSFIPVPDMSITLKTNGNPVQIMALCEMVNSNIANNTFLQIYVDGSPIPTDFFQNGTVWQCIPINIIVPMSAGTHKIDGYWRVDGNTGTLNGVRRYINAKEL